ncbi:MAG TPA: DUF2587 domain-containing protein, partial [Phycicoccus sp.]|nr:DUF2587 domain-containing protein [Phycicoccus sp.]
MPEQPQNESQQSDERTPLVGTVTDDKVVIVTGNGMGVAHRDGGADDAEGDGERPERRPTNPADLVEEPAKVMRIGSM